jgi:hypothetical protein
VTVTYSGDFDAAQGQHYRWLCIYKTGPEIIPVATLPGWSPIVAWLEGTFRLWLEVRLFCSSKTNFMYFLHVRATRKAPVIQNIII